ncbi:hypothetical protein ACP4OV_027508 [Aristida adscensionis]
MASFRCQHRSGSALLSILLASVLLLNSPVGLCGCYKRIFSFGDSIIDTGNFVHLSGKNPSQFKEPPYGMTFFGHPNGRISDGRVLVDFYARALELPLIPPSLPEKDSGGFLSGANFAVYAATALPPEYYRRWNQTVPVQYCLGMQIQWFKHLLQRIAPDEGDRKQLLNESLIVLGEIGGNDYNFWFGARRPRDLADQFLPDVVKCIASFAQELIGLGAKTIMVPNNFPIGCVPGYLSGYQSTNTTDYDEHGCLRWFNDFSARHNEALRGEVERLKGTNPGTKLIYADYYGAAMEFVRDPRRFGIGDPLVACCGGDGPYHTGRDCNSTAKVWGDPGGFASWDGMHMTDKAYSIIAQGVLNGTFSDPPLLSC